MVRARHDPDGNVMHTHSEYGILLAFPLQQWARKLAPVLLYTYNACRVAECEQKVKSENLQRLPSSTSVPPAWRYITPRGNTTVTPASVIVCNIISLF